MQVIDVTIGTLADRGYSRVTLTEVARRAKISHGLVLFHFQSKENLLAETLAFMAEEYYQNWKKAIAGQTRNPAAELHTLILADFTPEVCTRHKLAAWTAYWGGAQSLPVYQEICGAKDGENIAVLERISKDLLTRAGRRNDPVTLAQILRLTQERTWMNITAMPESYSADMARETVLEGARLLFGDQFTY
jgi:TetR/AcrR family transcriptional repressor of bet genes